MDKHGNFQFRAILSEHDIGIIDQIIKNQSRVFKYKGYSDWMNFNVRRWCRNVALPYVILHPEQRERKTLAITIARTVMDNTTNLDILAHFARVNNLTVTEVIQKFILDPPIVAAVLKEINQGI